MKVFDIGKEFRKYRNQNLALKFDLARDLRDYRTLVMKIIDVQKLSGLD